MLPNDPEQSVATALAGRVSRPDAVLLSIPLLLLAAVSLVVVPTVSLVESATVGTTAALIVTGYALFVDEPEN
ncbi:hypothetical protein [Halobacterium zhouii]|uniref:hypothetical protein n=1 Tax=Halobacterium zhouii TaxID=2902624 RepID=UPI001E3B7779|nr:hypothetical protein [Halobacterium zhouii]